MLYVPSTEFIVKMNLIELTKVIFKDHYDIVNFCEHYFGGTITEENAFQIKQILTVMITAYEQEPSPEIEEHIISVFHGLQIELREKYVTFYNQALERYTFQ